MQSLPALLLQSLEGLPGYERQAFLEAHQQAAPVSIRFNPGKPLARQGVLPVQQPVAWCPQAYYLPERPVFALHPPWHAGAYYVQEASSMFIGQIARQHLPQQHMGRTVLDLCAAPGGKSTLLAGLLRPQDVLVCNEVIQTRNALLVENMTRWGHAQVVVTQNDPEDFGQLPDCFDAIVVDAPCSGSGLFRRDAAAIQEWSPAAVDLCAQRQQRIVAQVWPALKRGGLFIYATCSYSQPENEDIVQWMQATLGAELLPVALEDSWGIQPGNLQAPAGAVSRFWPHKLAGEGFFAAAMRKPENGPAPQTLVAPVKRGNMPKKYTGKPVIPPAQLADWLKPEGGYHWYAHLDTWYAMPQPVWHFFEQNRHALRIRQAGIRLGQIMGKQLIPEHALALCTPLQPQVPVAEVELSDALAFLRKENMALTFNEQGWHLISYAGCVLGWVKHLGNRTNNYLPKTWRLRM